MIKRFIFSAAAAALLPAAALAQIGLPGLPGLPQLPDLPGADLPELPERRGDLLPLDLERLSPAELGTVLEEARLQRLARFVRDNRREVIADEHGNPAARGVVLVMGANAEMLGAAAQAGFRLLHSERIAGLDLSFARLAPPKGMNEVAAVRVVQSLIPDAEVSLDHYYLPSGSMSETAGAAAAGNISAGIGRIGIVDGGIRDLRGLAAEQRGFAPGAPKPSDHGTALASLVAGGRPQRPAAPGARLYVADVYGKGPKGGTATAIAQALGWLAEERVPVAALSLVGPGNPLLSKAVRAAQGRGMIIVAAVGNDGPAAPPAYPASFRGVLAVTGTDRGGRVLPEAGRALHLDFAAPGSGIKAHDRSGRMKAVRGTSFAVPLVAGRLAAHYPRQDIARIESAVKGLIAEARDLGQPGRDSKYGHGLVCGDCGAR